MIMSMFNIIAVTNRMLCSDDFLTQIRRLAKAKPYRIILREKDLSEAEYLELAEKVLAICDEEGAVCTLHTFISAASALRCPRIHLPLHLLEQNQDNLQGFEEVGVSVHSAEEAKLAQNIGATYLTAGHIFTTDCKKGLAARGLSFLQEIVKAVEIPVYAIGGIEPKNIKKVAEKGAAGACMMSGVMKERLIEEYFKRCLQEFTEC